MSISKSKKGLMALKINLEKSFDGLEWGFIRHTLSFFNFPMDWIELIMSYITTSSLSVLVIGKYYITSYLLGAFNKVNLSPLTSSSYAWNISLGSSLMKSTSTHGLGLEPRETAQPSRISSSRMISFSLPRPPKETTRPSKEP